MAHMAIRVAIGRRVTIDSIRFAVTVANLPRFAIQRSQMSRRRRYVGLVEEVEKQDKVAEVHEKGPLDVVLAYFAVFAALLLHVGRAIDVDAEHHLRDLTARYRDIHPLGYFEAHRTHTIVRVHERMHGEIHEDEPAARCGKLATRIPAVDEHGSMVIPMQEDELLFAGHYKGRVD